MAAQTNNMSHLPDLPENLNGLQTDPSRCLRMRFCESGCNRCIDVCPQGAIKFDDALSVDAQRCTGCLLCTAVCPSGAMEQKNNFYECVTELSRVPNPVLGCNRNRNKAHATVSCLGGLAEEHLVALSHTLSGKVTLNLTNCGECSNSRVVSHLLQRLHDVAEAALFDSNCRLVLAESEADVEFTEETVGRRSFFKAFGNSIFKSASVVLSSSAGERVERRTEYSIKRLPRRRAILSDLRKSFSPALELKIGRHFDFCVLFSGSCTNCCGCVAICPTGALQSDESGASPAFDQAMCTGCRLCQEFCADGALTVNGNENRREMRAPEILAAR